jgi:hypothetical protein
VGWTTPGFYFSSTFFVTFYHKQRTETVLS